MSVAKDAVADAVKLLLQEMMNDEKSEVRLMLKDAVFLALTQDNNIRQEVLSLVKEEIASDRTDIAASKGLIESALKDITKVKGSIKLIKAPWWKKLLAWVRTRG